MKKKSLHSSKEAELLKKLRDKSCCFSEEEKKARWVNSLENMPESLGSDFEETEEVKYNYSSPTVFRKVAEIIWEEGF